MLTVETMRVLHQSPKHWFCKDAKIATDMEWDSTLSALITDASGGAVSELRDILTRLLGHCALCAQRYRHLKAQSLSTLSPVDQKAWNTFDVQRCLAVLSDMPAATPEDLTSRAGMKRLRPVFLAFETIMHDPAMLRNKRLDASFAREFVNFQRQLQRHLLPQVDSNQMAFAGLLPLIFHCNSALQTIAMLQKDAETTAIIGSGILAGVLPELVKPIRAFLDDSQKFGDAPCAYNVTRNSETFKECVKMLLTLLGREAIPAFVTSLFVPTADAPSQAAIERLLALLQDQEVESDNLNYWFECLYRHGGDAARIPCCNLIVSMIQDTNQSDAARKVIEKMPVLFLHGASQSLPAKTFLSKCINDDIDALKQSRNATFTASLWKSAAEHAPFLQPQILGSLFRKLIVALFVSSVMDVIDAAAAVVPSPIIPFVDEMLARLIRAQDLKSSFFKSIITSNRENGHYALTGLITLLISPIVGQRDVAKLFFKRCDPEVTSGRIAVYLFRTFPRQFIMALKALNAYFDSMTALNSLAEQHCRLLFLFNDLTKELFTTLSATIVFEAYDREMMWTFFHLSWTRVIVSIQLWSSFPNSPPRHVEDAFIEAFELGTTLLKAYDGSKAPVEKSVSLPGYNFQSPERWLLAGKRRRFMQSISDLLALTLRILTKWDVKMTKDAEADLKRLVDLSWCGKANYDTVRQAIEKSAYRIVLYPSRESSASASRRKSNDDGRSQDSKKQKQNPEKERASGFNRMLKDAPVARTESPPVMNTARPPRQVKLIDIPVTTQPKGTIIVPPTANATEMLQKAARFPNIDDYVFRLLSWNFWDLTTMAIQSNGLESIPDSFSSVQEYTAAFEPLLLEECRAQILRGQEETNLDDNILPLQLMDVCCGDRFHDVGFQVSTSHSKFDSLSDNDLLALTFAAGTPSFTKRPKKDVPHLLGKITSIQTRGGSNTARIMIRFNIQKRLEILHTLRADSQWVATRLMNLSTINREFQALRGLPNYSLRPIILDPKTNPPLPPLSDAAIRDLQTSLQLNASQARAVATVARHREGFTLIQGPPGTGKTKTILGCIGALLSPNRHLVQMPGSDMSSKRHILVCAPSNAAVDELVRRIRRGINDLSGNKWSPSIVRFGTVEGIHETVKECTLDQLVESRLSVDPELSKHVQMSADLQEELEKIRKELFMKHTVLSHVDDAAAISELENEIRELNLQKRNLLEAMMNGNMRQDSRKVLDAARLRLRSQILNEADIILCTLSMSGHDSLTKELKHNFDAVIVDEACQAVEISTLIPLKYQPRQCILVGVLSQKAQGFEQSLFNRIQKSNQPLFLSVQYRMHPDIARFPSQMFYEGKLTNGENVLRRNEIPWHTHAHGAFPPCAFFDVKDGAEKQSKRGQSLFNSAEIDALISVYQAVCREYPRIAFAGRVGVITPYKEQKRRLVKEFTNRFGKSILECVDINTIDGFQGQEKDIIIMSCVRANRDGTIGFLSDVRRLNVGLTRARHSLWIFGHAESLVCNAYWKTLLTDAANRNIFHMYSLKNNPYQSAGKDVPRNMYAWPSSTSEKKRPASAASSVDDSKQRKKPATVSAVSSARPSPVSIFSIDDALAAIDQTNQTFKRPGDPAQDFGEIVGDERPSPYLDPNRPSDPRLGFMQQKR